MFLTDDPEQLPPEEAIPLLLGLLRAVGATVEISRSRHGLIVRGRFDRTTFVVEYSDGNSARDLHTSLVTLVEAAAPILVA